MRRPTPQHRTFGWRKGSDAAIEALLGALLGITVVVIEHGAHDAIPGIRALVRNAILGSCAITGARGIETSLSWALEQSRVATLFRTVIYAVGAWLGYFAGVALAGLVTGREARDFDAGSFHFAYALILSAVISVLVGLILHHNRKRNDRLLASIERLRTHEFAEKELEIAREMQKRLLPPPLLEHDGFRVTGRSEAARIVGGDFYDVLRLPDGTYAILVADVAGKGIAASLIVASCKAMIPFLAADAPAAEILTRLNQRLCDLLERREFVSMVLARFDPATGAVDLANGGMPDPLLASGARREAIVCEGDRLPLGSMQRPRYAGRRFVLERGARLLLFSDGLPEATVDDEPIGYERFEEIAASAGGDPDAIVEAVRGIEGIDIDDDVTVVSLERL